MGGASSKAASAAPKVAAAAGRRQYPSSPSILNPATSTSQSPSIQSQPTQAPPSFLGASSPQQQYREAPSSPQPSSQVHPNLRTAPPSDTRSTHIELDGRDPQFASSLRKLGPAVAVDRTNQNTQTFPTSSQPPVGHQGQSIFPPSASSPSTSPTSNPSLKIVQARDLIASRFAQESENMGRASFGGRTLITAKEIGEILKLKELQGKNDSEIEKQLRLKPGVVRELIGTRGVVGNV